MRFQQSTSALAQRAACVVMLGALACASDVTAPVAANPVHGVLITMTVPGTCIVGGCDPADADRHTLGLIRIVNQGTAATFLRACGPSPHLIEQQLVNGEWANVGPAVDCVFPSTPIQLAPGDSLRFNQFFARGTRRIGVGVGGNQTLSDEAFDTSASFEVP